jgi:hypothetical protein
VKEFVTGTKIIQHPMNRWMAEGNIARVSQVEDGILQAVDLKWDVSFLRSIMRQ